MEQKQTLSEKYVNNTSKYTKVYNIAFVMVVAITIISLLERLFFEDSGFSLLINLSYLVVGPFYIVVSILDFRGRMKNASGESQDSK